MIRLASAVLLACLVAALPVRAEDDDESASAPAYDPGAPDAPREYAPEDAPPPGEGPPPPTDEDAPPPAEAEVPPPDQADPIYAEQGTWVPASPWGRVWRPHVVVGWRPYTYGHWAWSPYGWTWVSSEPWGWAFHYGRWSWLDGYGWVWVPGTVWGPAWVDWWGSDGWIGWAPLGPRGWVGARGRYVFIHERDFCDRGLHGHLLFDYRRVPPFGRVGWTGRGGPPPLHRVEHVSVHPVIRVENPRRGDTFGTRRLPAPDRPRVHARGDVDVVRPAPVLPHDAGHGWAPRPPAHVEPTRPRGAFVTQQPVPTSRSHFRGEVPPGHGTVGGSAPVRIAPPMSAPHGAGAVHHGGAARGHGNPHGGDR